MSLISARRNTERILCPALAVGLFTALMLAALPARAQVNSERLRVGEPEEGFHAQADGAVSLRRGNVDFFEVKTSTRLEYNQGVHTPFVHGTLAFAEQNGSEIINNGFLHARWTAMWHHNVGSEVFGQVQFNEFIRLPLRALAGAGVRVLAYESADFEIRFGTGYMIEREDLDEKAIPMLPETDPAYHPLVVINHRSTSYVSFRFNVTERLFFNNTTFIQPRFDRLSDFRLLSEAALEVKLAEQLSLVVELALLHDNDPPPTVEKTDLNLQNKLRVRF